MDFVDPRERLERPCSSVLRLAPDQRAGLLGDLRELVATRFGGRVVRRCAFELVLARRAGVSPRG